MVYNRNTSSESLTKRSPDLDPINQDIHILWDKEPAGPYDPGNLHYSELLFTIGNFYVFVCL